jgi:hypothetical protein
MNFVAKAKAGGGVFCTGSFSVHVSTVKGPLKNTPAAGRSRSQNSQPAMFLGSVFASFQKWNITFGHKK